MQSKIPQDQPERNSRREEGFEISQGYLKAKLNQENKEKEEVESICVMLKKENWIKGKITCCKLKSRGRSKEIKLLKALIKN